MTQRVVFFILSIQIIFSACKKNTTSTPVPEPPKPVLVYQWNFEGADALHDLFIEDASVQKMAFPL